MARGTAVKTMAGLRVGDGLRMAARTSRRALPPPRRVSALEARRLAPALRTAGLRGALLSWDGQLEDDARLVVAVARTAAAHGARILTYAEVTGLREDGVEAVDALTGAGFVVRARRTVLATGVWTGALTSAVELRPSRGSHLLVPASRLGEPRAAVNVPVPGEHGRWVFALPRSDGLVAIGLTDVPAPGEPADDPRPDATEEAELLDRASAALDAPLRRRGRLRPLRGPASAGRRRRRHGRPLAPPPDRRRPERRARDRGRQAHHVSPHGPGRRRPADRPPVPHAPAAAGRRRRARGPAVRRRRPSGSCAGTAPRRPPSPPSPTAGPSCSSSSRPGCRCAGPSCCGRRGTSWR